MTQTTSFKANFKNAFSVFKWELKNRQSSLLVYSVLSAVFTAIIFTLCLNGGLSSKDEGAVQTAMLVFQLISSVVIFLLTAVFTIVYTAGNYSYLHSKRKADMYGSLPVSSSMLYLSKTASAYLFSVVPALFFFGLISIISISFGQPLVNETIQLFANLLLGTIACVSFYGVLAICCGTTLHSVLSFIAIGFAYPIAIKFIVAIIHAFFYGLPESFITNSFIEHALDPAAAYNGTHIIYWIVFSVVCLAGGTFLAQKRKNERAQNSFAYFLPAHIVKLLVSFLIGMFLGVLFGSINVFGNGYIGFIFGFVLGSVPAFLIAHLIYYKGLNKLLVTAIPLGAMVVVVIGAMAVINLDPFGYNSYMPHKDDIESAGMVASDFCYTETGKSMADLAKDAADDFTDSDMINKVMNVHSSMLAHKQFKSDEKFAAVWSEILYEAISPLTNFDNNYCISYKLKDGRMVSRVYNDSQALFSPSANIYTTALSDIIQSKEYFENYSLVTNIDLADVDNFRLTDDDSYYDGNKKVGIVELKQNDNVSAEQVNADKKKLLDAIIKDYQNGEQAYFNTDWYDDPDYDYDDDDFLYDLQIRYSTKHISSTSYFSSDMDTDYYQVFEGKSKNVIAALKEIGLIDSDNQINQNSPYYKEVKMKDLYDSYDSTTMPRGLSSLFFNSIY